MNTITVLGRLTKDPELRYSTGNQQTAIAKFTIADNKDHPKEGEKPANFWQCVSFGKQAEAIEKWLHKGQEAIIIGTLEQGVYNDKEGNKHSTLDLRVEKWRMTGNKSSNNNTSAPSTDDTGFMECESNPWM